MNIATPDLIRTLKVDRLTVEVYRSPDDVALAASRMASEILKAALVRQSETRVIFATGRSQKQCLSYLTNHLPQNIWRSVIGFHLDEYLGIAASHPASFRHYFKERLLSKVSMKDFYEIEGDTLLPMEMCERYERELRSHSIDLCFLGVGNNGHLAFNDPGVTDLNDPRWVKLVRLDEQNRQQQAGSTAFPTLQAVPQYAFTLTLSAIGSACHSLCLAFGEHKADIVNTLLTKPISPACPASVLRRFPSATLLVDAAAAANL